MTFQDRSFPALNAVRAIGAIMVVLTHAAFNTGQINHGWIGAALARLDFGVHRPLVQGLADGLFEAVEAVAARGADGHGVVVVGLEDVEERAVGDLVDLIEDQERRVVGQAELI